MSIAAVTNDIFTREDGEFLTRHEALPKDRISAVETGGCPHAAIREDISANLKACELLTATHDPLELILLESGGDNLAANFSPELADYTVSMNVNYLASSIFLNVINNLFQNDQRFT